MSCSISMSPDEWQTTRERLEDLTKEQLIQAIIDDLYEAIEIELNGEEYRSSHGKSFNLILEMVKPYEDHLKIWASHEVLVDRAFSLIDRHNTCDNGGFSLWIDRDGTHKVFIGEKLPEVEILAKLGLPNAVNKEVSDVS